MGGQRCEAGRCTSLMPRLLDAMAVAGGRAVDGRHLQVEALEDLENALMAAAGSLAPCSYDLSSFPPELFPQLQLLIDGEEVPRDPQRMNGWEIIDGQLELFGATCDRLRDGAAHSITARCE